MSQQTKFIRNLTAAFAAVLMSTIAVGAAVGPAHADVNPIGTHLHA